MTTLRPQSSIGKYQVLPSISSPGRGHDSLLVDPSPATSRSDGSEDQRGKDEMEYLTSRLAHQALVENSRRGDSRSGARETRPTSGNEGDHGRSSESLRSALFRQGQRDALLSSPGTSAEAGAGAGAGAGAHQSSSASSNNTASPDPEPATARSHASSVSQYGMEEAPKPPAEGQVLLGIKIPTDGTRHKQYFNKRDQLRCIVLFAEEVSGEDFSNHVLVLATPRQRFDNLSETIEAAGLQSKSVVHLEEVD